MASPPEPTIRNVLLQWSLDPAVLTLAVVGLVAYLGDVRRYGQRHPDRRWPRARTTAFGAGMAVLVFASSSGFARYDVVLLSWHTVQHVLLGMVAPLLLALGRPVTLVLQSSSRPTKVVLLRWLHHPWVRALSHPAAAWAIFGGTLFALYFGPIFEASLTNTTLHAAVHLHFVAAGCLFCWTALAKDPGPRPLPAPARLLFVLVAVPFHAFLGLAVLNSRARPLGGEVYAAVGRTWGPSIVADQATAAGILWAVGDLFGLVLGGIVLAGWMADDARRQAREDRVLDRAQGAAG